MRQCAGNPNCRRPVKIIVVQYYIANVINFEEIKLGVHLVEYDRSRQKLRHVALIKDHLGIKTSCTKTMATIALEFAKNRENIETVFNCTVESMIFENMELPSFGSLKTIVELSRRRANNFFYKKIYSSLSPKQIDHLDKCLFNNFKSYEKQRSWKDIKTDPPTVSANNVKHYTEHVQWLQSLVINKKIFNEIPLERYNQLYVEGISLNLYKLNRLPKMKRYALVSTVIQKATEMAVDNLTTMIIKTYNIMKSSAKNKLLAYKTSRLNVVDDLVYNFECVL